MRPHNLCPENTTRSFIGYGELQQLCTNLGFEMNAEQLQGAVQALDLDGSNRIERNEFVAWWMNPSAVAERAGVLW